MATASQRPDLQALVTRVQEALRVKDWAIEIGYVPDLEMHGGPVWGTCASNADVRRAWISIRDPLTPPPGSTPEDAFAEVAKTVIHEVAHLLFVPFGATGPAATMAEENAVWTFSEILEKVLLPGMVLAPAATMARWPDAPAATHGRPIKNQAPTAPKAKKVSAPTVAPGGKKKMAGMTLATMSLLVKALKLDPETATVDDIHKAIGVAPAEAGDAPEPTEPTADPAMGKEATPAAPPAKDPEAEAAKARMIAITGKPSVGEAARTVETWKKDSAELADLKARTTANQAALDASERKALVARLVTECGELPATAWKDPLAKDLEPGPAWAAVDLDTLRARVATLSKAPKAREVKPPDGADNPHGLTADELRICEETKCKPEVFAQLRARITTQPTAKN